MPDQGGAGKEAEGLLQVLLSYYRQAMVGRRLTGIIHNFNTPLQVILMQAELLERKLREEQDTFAPRLPADLQENWQAGFDYRRHKNRQLQEVGADLQRLLQWLQHYTFHAEEHGPQEIDLNEMMATELEGYQAERFFKHRVDKRFQEQERLPPISGYYVDFSQSFTNIVDNALEALVEVPEPVLTIKTWMEAGRRIIAVGDNGPGIPVELQDQIFAPFFSTKSTPETPRAGLGLFFARRLLSPYGGEVSCLSRPGQTWFQLILP